MKRILEHAYFSNGAIQDCKKINQIPFTFKNDFEIREYQELSGALIR